MIFALVQHLSRPILKVLLLQCWVQILGLKHATRVSLRTLILLQVQLKAKVVLFIVYLLLYNGLSLGRWPRISDRLSVIFQMSSPYGWQIRFHLHVVSTGGCVVLMVISRIHYFDILLSNNHLLFLVKYVIWFT